MPVALDPGPPARAQLAAQLAIYLGRARLRRAVRRAGLRGPGRARARAAPGGPSWRTRSRSSCSSSVGALGSADDVAARIATYHDAGADAVGVAPSTAEDPRGSGVLAALSPTKELAP